MRNARKAYYHVTILTATGWQHSRICNTKRVALNWAKWCQAKWAAQVWHGCVGGELIADLPKA